MNGFRKFLLRGNVVDLAVGVVIGVAFASVVTALTADLITPLIGALFGKPEFGALSFTINHSHFRYGHFLDAVLAFVLIAAAVYFFVVVPVGALYARYAPAPPEPGPTRECPECLSAIP